MVWILQTVKAAWGVWVVYLVYEVYGTWDPLPILAINWGSQLCLDLPMNHLSIGTATAGTTRMVRETSQYNPLIMGDRAQVIGVIENDGIKSNGLMASRLRKNNLK